jgi:hypothetical protein
MNKILDQGQRSVHLPFSREADMNKERELNTAMAVFLADKVFEMTPAAHVVLALALAALIGRMVWTWTRPAWARYPATVAALMALALLTIPK